MGTRGSIGEAGPQGLQVMFYILSESVSSCIKVLFHSFSPNEKVAFKLFCNMSSLYNLLMN